MICDQLANAGRYAALGGNFARALAWLRAFDGARPDGRCDIAGQDVYANLMSYETKLPGGLTHETHRDYADVQCLLTGAERMLYTPAERLGPGNGYVAERDYELFDTPTEPDALVARPGQFVIFFPGEGHRPGVAHPEPRAVRKVVVKVRL